MPPSKIEYTGSYEDAKQTRDALYDTLHTYCALLHAAKKTPQTYTGALREYEQARTRAKNFNAFFVKTFAKERRAEMQRVFGGG